MPSLEKELMFKEVADKSGESTIFISSFNGLTVAEIEPFRRDVRKVQGKAFVAKKTLIKKRFAELGIEDVESFLENHVVLTAVEEEPQKVSKVLVKYEKDFDKKFAVKGVFTDGEMRDRKYVVGLSKLPSREQLIATLLGTMNAPISNFVLTLNGVVRNFTVVLNEIKKQKETNQGEASE